MICRCLVFALLTLPAMARADSSESDQITTAKKLYDEGHWEEAARIARGSPDQPAELDYIAGMALARLQRWPEARESFASGLRKTPRDKRFLLELAGVDYKQKDFAAAKRNLHAALRLDPEDAYAHDFLATLYFLEGNLEAALKYWNPIGQPRLASVSFSPPSPLSPALQDRVLAFNVPAVLQRSALLTTQARLANLNVFTGNRIELTPQEKGGYDAVVRAPELAGWNDGILIGSISLLRGLPYETIYPEFYNLRGTGTNVLSLARWDDQKRRFWVSFSSPLRHNPALRLRVYFDARNENWNLTETLFASGGLLTNLNLRKLAAGAELRSVVNGRWAWSGGIEVSDRTFRNLASVTSSQALRFFSNGASFKSWARVDRDLLRIPERRFTVLSSGEVQVGREFAAGLGAFTTVKGSLRSRWLPQAKDDDYEMNAQLRAANTVGTVPFDEFFQLGVERDNDLWLRGHAGTTDGRKGRAPLGRRYVLLNWEMDKNVYRGPFFTIKLGPFLDTGAIADPSGLFGSQRWLWDTGAQCKVRVLGRVTVVISYGRDLRGARNVVYASALQ
ncbi:MAG: tetratricopeptide repeat protein [Candidatus Acidiferrales bacterium]